MPYVRRFTEYNKNKAYPELIEISINQKYIDAVNYKPALSESSQCLEFLHYFCSRNLLNILTMKKPQQINFNDGNLVDTPYFSFCWDCLRNKNGKVISRKFSIWHQDCIENGNFYSEYYATFEVNSSNRLP